jgi:hypothetical protein
MNRFHCPAQSVIGCGNDDGDGDGEGRRVRSAPLWLQTPRGLAHAPSPFPSIAVSPSFQQPHLHPTARLVLTASSVTPTTKTPIPITRCLAAVVPRSTSPALATARARATSPTNSNGTSPSFAQLDRRRSPAAHLPLQLCTASSRGTALAPRRRAAVPSLPSNPVACAHPAAPSLAPSSRFVAKPSLTTSKLWSPRPLRYSSPALSFQQAVST